MFECLGLHYEGFEEVMELLVSLGWVTFCFTSRFFFIRLKRRLFLDQWVREVHPSTVPFLVLIPFSSFILFSPILILIFPLLHPSFFPAFWNIPHFISFFPHHSFLSLLLQCCVASFAAVRWIFDALSCVTGWDSDCCFLLLPSLHPSCIPWSSSSYSWVSFISIKWEGFSSSLLFLPILLSSSWHHCSVSSIH